VESRQLINCCGVRILHTFGFTCCALIGPEHRNTKDKVRRFLLSEESCAINEEEESILMAVLNDQQVKALLSVFMECGWKVIANERHINHGHDLCILIKNVRAAGEAVKIEEAVG